ncbi:hypothetical protein [Thiofilum flexile]|uniref:hypothetical protein n=1 Tax=Thiofilum flexile TaxID=125627 RepID=UPI0003720FBE|nr:hypothetical protein [Thiofilum flexile]
MLNITDWTIIGIALAAATIALLFLRPQTNSRDLSRLRDLRLQAEQEQRQSAEWISTLKQAAEQADTWSEQAKRHTQNIELYEAKCQAHCEESKELLEQLRTQVSTIDPLHSSSMSNPHLDQAPANQSVQDVADEIIYGVKDEVIHSIKN